MHSSLLALAASLSLVAAQSQQGFNYGSVTREGVTKNQADFEAEFNAARKLPNTNKGFTSARLYTTIQDGTTSDPISAIPAAIASDTKLLLGMWASSGSEIINNEIAALLSAIEKYGKDFTSRVNGISVGSEDLYRTTPTGLMNDPKSVGAAPDTLVNYINQVRKALSSTALSSVPIGHVDTWTAWQNGSNSAVAEAVDFLGFNSFPYFQTTESNGIENAESLIEAALEITKSAAGGKPVIITETGWPVGGKTSHLAEAGTKNAKTFWDKVGCPRFGKVDIYWYTLVDANTDTANQPEFGIVGTTVSSTPLFDLTCPAASSSDTTSSGHASATSSGSAIATGTAVSGGEGNFTIQTRTDVTNTNVATATGTGTSGSSGSDSSVTTPATGSATSTPVFDGAASTMGSSQIVIGAVALVAAFFVL